MGTENAWANIGNARYLMIEYPKWGLNGGEGGKWNGNKKHFWVSIRKDNKLEEVENKMKKPSMND